MTPERKLRSFVQRCSLKSPACRRKCTGEQSERYGDPQGCVMAGELYRVKEDPYDSVTRADGTGLPTAY